MPSVEAAMTSDLENLAEMVLMARDYMFRAEYLSQIEETLEHHRVRARVDFYRPALQQIIKGRCRCAEGFFRDPQN